MDKQLVFLLGIGILVLLAIILCLKCCKSENYSVPSTPDWWVLYTFTPSGQFSFISDIFKQGNNTICVNGKQGSIVWNGGNTITINDKIYGVVSAKGANFSMIRDEKGNE